METNGVEVIVFNGIKWLNEKHIEAQIKHSNLREVTSKYPSDFRKRDKSYKKAVLINLVEDF